LLQTSSTLEPAPEEVQIRFFQGKLPCGRVEVDAVEHDGVRMYLDTSGGYSFNKRTKSGRPEAYRGNIKVIDRFVEHSIDIRQAVGTPRQTEYFLKPGVISLTKVKDTVITVHFKRHACDEEGFPLIPDNGNYKEALYWFVRGKLMGAGIID